MVKLLLAVEEADEEKVLQLIKNGEDVNTVGVFQDTPLHVAAKKMNTNIVRILIRNGANVNLGDFYQDTPLHSAVHENNKEIIKLLIQFGSDINVKNMAGYTPLHNAVIRTNDLDLIFMMVKNGAGINIKNRFHQTPLSYAIQTKKLEILNMLIDFGGIVNFDHKCRHFSPLQLALQGMDDEFIWILLEKDVDINVKLLKDKNSTNKLSVVKYCDQIDNVPCKNVIITHLIKRMSLNLHVNEENLNDLNEYMLLFNTSWKEEISKMKSFKLCQDYGITVYDVLTKSIHQLSNYLISTQLRDKLETYDYSEHFPLCQTTLTYRLKKAAEKMELSIQGFKIIEHIFNEVMPSTPNLCIYEILNNFNETEIKYFIKLFKDNKHG